MLQGQMLSFGDIIFFLQVKIDMGSRFFGFIDFSINKIILDIFVKKLKKKKKYQRKNFVKIKLKRYFKNKLKYL